MKPRTLLTFHRWLALAFAPFLMLQAVTGAALLFRAEIAALIDPPRATASGTSVPLSAMAQAARQAWPDYRLARIYLPETADGTAFAQLDGANASVRHVLIDPGNGAVLSQGSIWHYPLEAALQLHYRLASGNVGLAFVGLYGIALALLAITGLWHWWPGRGRVRQALRIPARTPQRLKLRMWHRSAGAVVAAALLVISVTGVLTLYPDLTFASSPAAPPAAPPTAAQRIDAAYVLAQTQFPGSNARDVRFRPDGTVAVNFFAPRGGAWAVDTVTIDAAGRVANVTPHEANTALWAVTLPIHTGTIASRIGAGAIGRILMLAAAAGLLFLSISGPLAWWRARKKKQIKTLAKARS